MALANVLTQPNTLPSMQRAFGRGACETRLRDGATVLETLWQEGCAKLRLPRHEYGFEAVMINSSGGLTGGDRLNWSFGAGPDTTMTITTQACEKIYAASAGIAEVHSKLKLENGSRLNWLPQEAILFDNCALARRLEVDLTGNAELLLCEPVLLGREAMSETVRHATFRDQWRVRRGGELIHAEQLSFGPEFYRQTQGAATLHGARAFASILLIAPDAHELLDPARSIIGDQGGVSFWNGKLLARLIATDGYSLRKRLIPLLTLLNKKAALPKCWSL